MKDKLIIGTRFTKLVPQLLNDDLTLQKTIELCRNFELTTMQTRELNKEEKVEVVKAMHRQENQKQWNGEVYDCNRCGRKHKRGVCPAFDKVCISCGLKGHFAIECKTKQNVNKKVSEVTQQVRVNEESEAEEEFYIHVVEDQCDDDWYETIEMNGKTVAVKLDTGAQCNVLPVRILHDIPVNIEPSRTRNLVTYNGQPITVVGEVSTNCIIKGRSRPITFKIVKENVTPVMGRKTCLALNLIARIHTINLKDSDIFDGLGCLQNYVYDIDLVENPS